MSTESLLISPQVNRRVVVGALSALGAHVVLTGCGAHQTSPDVSNGGEDAGDQGVGGDIVAGEVVAGEVVAGEVVAGEVVAGEVVAGEVGAGDIVAGDIGAGDIGAGDIGAGDIGAGDIVAGDIVAGDIVAGEVGAGEVVAGDVAAGEAVAGDMVGGESGGTTPPEVCIPTPPQIEGPFYTAVPANVNLAEGIEGAPLTVEITVVDERCIPIPNAHVEIWHANAQGVYSGFVNQGVDTTDELFLRGDGRADREGVIRFLSVYPGWYPGRAVHVHFKVSADQTPTLTSQFYFPDEVSREVYQTAPYTDRGSQDTPNSSDSFLDRAGDQAELLIAEMDQGSQGYIARLRVTI